LAASTNRRPEFSLQFAPAKALLAMSLQVILCFFLHAR